MSSLRRPLAVAACAILASGPAAFAGDLVTPEVYVGLQSVALCKLLNVSTSTIAAQVQMESPGQCVIVDSGPLVVGPGDNYVITKSFPGNHVYCRFVKASKSRVRGALTVFGSNPDTSDTVVVPAS